MVTVGTTWRSSLVSDQRGVVISRRTTTRGDAFSAARPVPRAVFLARPKIEFGTTGRSSVCVSSRMPAGKPRRGFETPRGTFVRNST
jgi:hypothetical protein